jgi:hypothetical protein
MHTSMGIPSAMLIRWDLRRLAKEIRVDIKFLAHGPVVAFINRALLRMHRLQIRSDKRSTTQSMRSRRRRSERLRQLKTHVRLPMKVRVARKFTRTALISALIRLPTILSTCQESAVTMVLAFDDVSPSV